MWTKVKVIAIICAFFLITSFSVFHFLNFKNEKYQFSKILFLNGDNSMAKIVNPWSNYTSSNKSSDFEICPLWPRQVFGKLQIDQSELSWNEIENKHKNLKIGGYYKPKDCEPRFKVAVIIPFRDRESHLKIFLNHMIPILIRQNLEYQIYVIEEADNYEFNRASLFNVGFLEALDDIYWDCFIFHDVDLLPEDDRNLYNCPDSPRHMSVAVNTMNYQLPYEEIFGGVVAFTTQDFSLVNGFSNQFWGWGGEDDDMHNRVINKNLTLTRYSAAIARYTMIHHIKANPSKLRMKKLTQGSRIYDRDGLNNIQYEIIKKIKLPLYTKISVHLRNVLPLDINSIKTHPIVVD